jgi:Ni/Co efflux regulator RcnB
MAPRLLGVPGMKNTLTCLVVASSLALPLLAACHREGPAETAGRKVDNAAHDVKESAHDTKEDVKKGLKR